MDRAIRVLHVDDEPRFGDMTATYLEREDPRIEVRTETSAEDGLETLEVADIDCIVSDYDMPGATGIEFLRSVRQDHPDLPFILFTGKGSEEVASEAISAGVTDYLQKERGSEQYAVLANRVVNAVERSRAEQQLDQKNRLLSTLFDALPVGVLVEDASRDVLAVNQRHLEMFDISGTPEDVVGRSAEAIVQEVSEMFVDSEAFEARTNELVANEEPVTREEIALVDGRTFTRTHRPISLPDGDGYLWVYQDLTEQKRREDDLQQREESLYRVYEIIADDERSVSEKIDALLDVARETIGTSYATFSHVHGDQYEFELVGVDAGVDLEAGTTTDRDELPICDRVVRTEQRLVLDDVAEQAPDLADPEWGISCYIGAPVVVDDRVYGTFCFYDTEARAEDFTDWEATFVDLLSDWVSLALTRKRTHDHLERQNERLLEFANFVSHDLENPLRVAMGYLELAREEVSNEHLETVADSHERMQALIEDLLTWARTGEAVSKTEPVDVAVVAEDCWGDLDTGDATLAVEVDHVVLADENRFRQLLTNLLENAVVHGGDRVTVGGTEEGFYVADDGPGVDEDDRDRLFESGFSTAADGTGFGLAIVQQIAAAHGWSVAVSDAADGGARFDLEDVEFADG